MLRTSVFAVFALSGAAAAQTLTPAAVFGVDFRNNAFSFFSSTLSDAVETRFRDRRAFAEFDIRQLDGPTIISASLATDVTEQFSFGFGISPATFEVAIYSGNGQADLSDFDIAATPIGTVQYVEDFDTAVLDLDARAALQSLVDSGATFAGVRIRAVETGVGQVDFNDIALNVESVPAPAAAALLGLAGSAAAR
ncbi:MAG: hypothetical protein AAF747_11300, partial [Planctomycetota bacterium]